VNVSKSEEDAKSEAGSLTDIEGVKVGHWTDSEAATGLTAVICPPDTVGSGEVRGAAPGTREVSLLSPQKTVQNIDAVLLTGGSAYGLEAASGVMRYLSECGRGHQVGQMAVPIVPAAVIFDLVVGKNRYPRADDAYQACQTAGDEPVIEGSVGAGTGATVGKVRGMQFATKRGVGSCCITLPGGARVASLACVNAMGNVVDGDGSVVAGVRSDDAAGFVSAERDLLSEEGANTTRGAGGHTTLVVVITDAHMDKSGCLRLAQVAHDGLARSIRPCHTACDGDTVFALSVQRKEASPVRTAVAAVQSVAMAVRRAVRTARTVAEIPAAGDLR